MFERDEYPAGVPCWVDTSQPDPDAAASFYGGLFGWEFEDRMPSDAPGKYLIAELHGRDIAAVGSQPDAAPSTPVWNTYVSVDSAADAAANATNAGGSVLAEPFEVSDAGRMAVLADREGAAFCAWEARGHKGAQLVNEPGTWNFSELNTRDPDRAKAFYGAIFGWEASDFEMEGVSYGVFRRPGYGDFLERTVDPEIRTRQGGVGAPEGFEDAVAWLVPITDEGSREDVPPHWSVTFTVDDADAMAERAAELGGTVTVPPFDAGPTRSAVLADPEGAAFTVSKFNPAG
jgi:uncharacterized protein